MSSEGVSDQVEEGNSHKILRDCVIGYALLRRYYPDRNKIRCVWCDKVLSVDVHDLVRHRKGCNEKPVGHAKFQFLCVPCRRTGNTEEECYRHVVTNGHRKLVGTLNDCFSFYCTSCSLAIYGTLRYFVLHISTKHPRPESSGRLASLMSPDPVKTSCELESLTSSDPVESSRVPESPMSPDPVNSPRLQVSDDIHLGLPAMSVTMRQVLLRRASSPDGPLYACLHCKRLDRFRYPDSSARNACRYCTTDYSRYFCVTCNVEFVCPVQWYAQHKTFYEHVFIKHHDGRH